jgi:hypothetical protein
MKMAFTSIENKRFTARYHADPFSCMVARQRRMKSYRNVACSFRWQALIFRKRRLSSTTRLGKVSTSIEIQDPLSMTKSLLALSHGRVRTPPLRVDTKQRQAPDFDGFQST